MYIVNSYPLAVFLCFITMLCWGSWANTQKLASKEWRFQLFYWDYSIGIMLISLVLGLTLGSIGEEGRGFVQDLQQVSTKAFWMAFLGGVVFNVANLLVVAAIDIAGMAVAFPVGIGIALVLGVVNNYMVAPSGNAVVLAIGVFLIVLAILLDAVIYKKISDGKSEHFAKGLVLSILGGILMGFFYRFVATSMVTDFVQPELGKLTPYGAVFIFSIGLFASNFVFNSWMMFKPFTGQSVT